MLRHLTPCLPKIGLLPGEEPWKSPSWRLVFLLGWSFYSSVKWETLPFRKNSCTVLIEHLRSCGLQDPASPVELSFAQQPFLAPSAALHTRGGDLMASQSDPGRPWFLLPVTGSAAQVNEPAKTTKEINCFTFLMSSNLISHSVTLSMYAASLSLRTTISCLSPMRVFRNSWFSAEATFRSIGGCPSGPTHTRALVLKLKVKQNQGGHYQHNCYWES